MVFYYINALARKSAKLHKGPCGPLEQLHCFSSHRPLEPLLIGLAKHARTQAKYKGFSLQEKSSIKK